MAAGVQRQPLIGCLGWRAEDGQAGLGVFRRGADCADVPAGLFPGRRSEPMEREPVTALGAASRCSPAERRLADWPLPLPPPTCREDRVRTERHPRTSTGGGRQFEDCCPNSQVCRGGGEVKKKQNNKVRKKKQKTNLQRRSKESAKYFPRCRFFFLPLPFIALHCDRRARTLVRVQKHPKALCCLD